MKEEQEDTGAVIMTDTSKVGKNFSRIHTAVILIFTILIWRTAVLLISMAVITTAYISILNVFSFFGVFFAE